MRTIRYPNQVEDLVVVEFRGPGRIGFLVRPKTPGMYRILVWPRDLPDPALVSHHLLEFPDGIGPPLHPVLDLRQHPARRVPYWTWVLMRSLGEDRWLTDLGGALSGQPLLEGGFRLVQSPSEEEIRTVAWSCHQPFATSGTDAVLGDSALPILEWYAAAVARFDPHVIWGQGDTGYSDGTEATDFSNQVYDQGSWHRNPVLVEWLREEFRTMYRQFWSLPGMSKVMREVSHLFIWDDHEIHDGWGSEGKDFLPGNLAMFRIASDVAQEYILNAGPRVRKKGAEAHQAYILGPLAAFIFDTRSCRNYEAVRDRLISAQQMEDFRRFLKLARRAAGITDLVTCTTVPFVNLRSLVEKIASSAPDLLNDTVLQGVRDDVRDAWTSPGNLDTLRVVLAELRDFMRERSDVRIWNVSGDIHVASAFEINMPGISTPVIQVTTSAITNRTHPWAIVRELTEISDIEFLEGVGEIHRIWPTVTDPNVLFMRTGLGGATFTLMAFAEDGSGEYELVISR